MPSLLNVLLVLISVCTPRATLILLLHDDVLSRQRQHPPAPAPEVPSAIIPPDVAHHRTYFYVGGRYTNASDRAGTIRTGQLYVERLVPEGGARKKSPLVFWHGAAQSGTNWLNCMQYLVDQPQRGRSPWEVSQGRATYFPVEEIESIFTAPAAFGKYPSATFHTQWPGSGRRGDAVFDQFYASQLQYQADDGVFGAPLNRAAGVALVDAIVSPTTAAAATADAAADAAVILVTHSQGGPYGWAIADARPDRVKAVLAIEPEGPPFRNALVQGNASARPYGVASLPLAYAPPIASPAELTQQLFPPAGINLTACRRQAAPARQLVNLAKVPVAVLTSQASYHAAYDYCTVLYLRQAGVDVEDMNLTSMGIRGNGHFLFLEKNNLEIAAVVDGWFDKIGS